MSFHILKFKDPPNCPIFKAIQNGEKVVEGRKNSSSYSKIQVDDFIYLDDKKGILCCKVTYINKYSDVKEYLQKEEVKNALPCVDSIEDGIKIYESFVSKEEINNLKDKFGFGFLGIGIKFLAQVNKYFIPTKNPWFDYIVDRKKMVEGRLAVEKFKKIKKYDLVYFVKGNLKVLVMVKNVLKYNTILDMLKNEGLNNIFPKIESLDKGVETYKSWYSDEDIKKYGLITFKFKVKEDYFKNKYVKYKNKYVKTVG